MKTRAELKAMAKQQIKGNIGMLFVVTLIIGAVSAIAGAVAGVVPGVGLAVSVVVTPALSLSLVRVYLALVNAGKKPEAKDAFTGFDDFWTAFKTTFLVGLYTFLWSLLFVIPGIIKAFSYSQAMYIVAENKGIGAREAIRQSQAMMDGHKAELFVLGLSFIGWGLLVTVTLGIAAIWVVPYMQATMVNFYNNLKPAEVEGVVEAAIESAEEEA